MDRGPIIFCFKDSFLGEGWAPVLLEDSVRFQWHGKLGPVGIEPKHGEMAWVETGELESKYPALHELVTCLHALPFELNLKEPNLSLARPFRGKRDQCSRRFAFLSRFLRSI